MAEVVGVIKFGNFMLDVYRDLDNPLFMASDVAGLIDFSENNNWALTRACEEDEKLQLTVIVGGQRRSVTFVTESGLYNILEQSRKPIARKWRRIINDDLVELRKSRGKNVVQQFDDWNHKLDTLFVDPETGTMMQSVTVQGGDVIQVPYRKGEDL